MADAVVFFLLGEISVFLKEEKNLLGAVRGDVEFIRHELEHMRAFLRATELMLEEPADSQLSAWVKEVREIAFDIEDTLDEYKLRLRDHPRGPLKALKIFRFFKNLKYRHDIASQIQNLKSRVIGASERRQRYQHNMPELLQRHAVVNNFVSDQRANALLLEEQELVGIDDPKRQLLDLLVGEDSTLKVISVVGMGGLGKTTLVKKVYDYFSVQKHFKIHVWITVSQSFKIDELLKGIVCQLFEDNKQQTPQGMDLMQSYELKRIIKNFLRETRFLLVLDDIWDEVAWDVIKHALPKTEQGSRVILTTRNDKVAEAPCSDFNDEVYRLKPLSSELSWKLFCTKTFRQDQCPQHLNVFAKHIVEKCHGLPLAIVAVSGVLATKSRADEWEMVARNLGDEFQSDKLRSVKRILLLSYNDLSFNLKACMLHISMFPEDCRMPRIWLASLWIVEGFVEERDGKTLEEVADIYFKELLGRNLILIDDNLEIYCKVHDLVREIILSKAKDQNFVEVVNEKTTRWPGNARRLCFHNVPGNAPYSNQRCGLKSLLAIGYPNILVASLAIDLRLLKVLDLRETNLEIFPNEITKLYHLRHLDFSRTRIRDIPSSIGKLQNLQYLGLWDTNVTSLPCTILKLQQLRTLIVTSFQPELRGFPGFPGIRRLTCIQSLLMIEVNVKGGIDVIQELGELTQLRWLGISKLKKEYGPALCSLVEKLKSLEHLDVYSIDEQEILDVQSISSPPKFLERLFLMGRLEKLPCWIQSLHCLEWLWLQDSQLHDSILEATQDLPNLVNLVLQNASHEDELCFKARGFQKLRVLWLVDLGGLRRVEVEKGSMPYLKELRIMECPRMENVPFGVEHLCNLTRVVFDRVSDDLVEKKDSEGEDYWRLKHIPRVDIKR